MVKKKGAAKKIADRSSWKMYYLLCFSGDGDSNIIDFGSFASLSDAIDNWEEPIVDPENGDRLVIAEEITSANLELKPRWNTIKA